MEFRKELIIPPSGLNVEFNGGVVMMGSCFAESIGQLLSKHRFNVDVNSHGILFNPISICNALYDLVENRVYTSQDLVAHQEKYVSLNHHGRFSTSSTEETLEAINESIHSARRALITCETLVLTFGSANAWKYRKTGQIVANCHKIPQKAFEKTLITHQEIEQSLIQVIRKIRELNPKINIVLTVSPVRYYRDGIVANNLSKSHLLIACHNLTREPGLLYFPAYEFVMDDLRDYRFFKEDMIHPNEQAILYIWKKFQQWCMSPEVIEKVERIGALLKGLDHRPHQSGIADDQARKASIGAQIEAIRRS